MSAQRDPDFDRIGEENGWDSELHELAEFMRAAPHPCAHVEPAAQFRVALRRRLMREALEQARQAPVPWYRRLLAPQPMAWAGAGVGLLLIFTVVAVSMFSPRQGDHVNVAVVSPQQDKQLVSTVQPIELKFSQPMDTSSVHVAIQPTTQAISEWQGTTLRITPLNGSLAPNTQYQVTVTSARTKQGQAVAKIQPVVFSTGPTPTPTPSAGPTPTPAPTPIQNPHLIAPIGSAKARWTADGTGLVLIGPNGQLQQFPAAGGTGQKLADGAALAAVGPDGSPAWVSGGVVTWKSTTVSGVLPLALGFRQGSLLVATASDVETADRNRVVALKETAYSADFSPFGDRLAYVGPTGVHVVDLSAGGRDTLLGPGNGNGGEWSQDGKRYAYTTDAGVSVGDAIAATSARLVDLPGVTGLSWSRGNELLLSTASWLYLARYTDGSPVTARKLAEGSFAQPQWAPGGNGLFSYRRGADLWVARVQGAVPGVPVTPAPTVSQDDVVSAFMLARKNQQADQALGFLDAAARDAFSRGLNLVYTDPSTSLARYYVLLSQPGRVVVRLVLARGQTQTAVDETLVIPADPNGHPQIHAVTETPRVPFAAGPEVLGVSVANGQVQVVFDSDLDPSSVSQPGAVGIRGVSTQASFDAKQRTVTLTVPGGLTAGTTYDLQITPALQDMNQRRAVSYDLAFAGPGSSPAATSLTASPSPTSS
jgi:hypothetical protein